MNVSDNKWQIFKGVHSKVTVDPESEKEIQFKPKLDIGARILIRNH